MAGNGTWSALYGGAAGGEEMEGLWRTSDGGFLVSGSTDSYRDEAGDAWLLKITAKGAIVWQKSYGGAGNEYIIDVKETPDGGIIAAGWTASFGAGGHDFWLLRLDGAGNIEWEKTYGGAGTEQAWSVDLTRDGGFIVAGGTTSFGAGATDCWLLKLDAGGNIEWQKSYGGAADDGGGGDYNELVVRVLEDLDGNYVVATETFSFGAGDSDIWLFKVDGAGDIIWQKSYGGFDSDSLWSFQEASTGGYIVPGVSVSFSPDGSGDLWVLRLDKNGDILWQRLYGVPGYWDEAISMGATSDGGSLIGGYTEEGNADWDLFLLRLDAAGNAVWQRRYEYRWDWPNAMVELPDGGFFVVGVAWPNDQGLPEDLWVLKLAADGTIGPSCNLVQNIDLVRVETNVQPATTHASVKNTNVVPQASAAIVRNSPAVPRYLCVGPVTAPAPGEPVLTLLFLLLPWILLARMKSRGPFASLRIKKVGNSLSGH